MTAIFWPCFCGNETIYDAFWNDALTINTESPDLTLCFQRSVITWSPLLPLWFSSPFKIFLNFSRKSVNKWHVLSKFHFTKILLTVIQVFCAIIMAGTVARNLLINPNIAATVAQNFSMSIGVNDTETWFDLESSSEGHAYITPADHVAGLLRIATMVLVLGLLTMDYVKGVTSSAIFSLFWPFLLLCDIFICHSIAKRSSTVDASSPAYTVFFAVYFACVIVQSVLVLFSDHSASDSCKEGETETVPLLQKVDHASHPLNIQDHSQAKASPRLSTSFWGRVTFSWLICDIIRTYRKGSVFSDLYRLTPDFSTDLLLPKFFTHYNKDHKTRSDRQTFHQVHAPLWRALSACVCRDYAVAILLLVMATAAILIQPQILDLLIDFVSDKDPHTWKGVFLVFCVLFANITGALLNNNVYDRAFSAGLKAATTVCALVYRKAMRLSSTSRKEATVGHILNHMAVDSQKIEDMYHYGIYLCSLPLLTVPTVYLLWDTVGLSCISGIAVMAAVLTFNLGYLANTTFKLQKGQMFHKDLKLKYFTEILAAIKTVKMYAWEPYFQKKIMASREEELKTIIWINLLNGLGSMSVLLYPYLASLAIYMTYVLSDPDHVLGVDTAFVTFNLVSVLEDPLQKMPIAVAAMSQGIASIKRLTKFLELDEVEEGPDHDNDPKEVNSIEMKNASYSWARDENRILHDVTMTAPRGRLVAVVGAMGSGKSSLINALLGDMFQKSGSTKLHGSLAYVPQQPWILQNTFRENIIFGKPMIGSRYQEVITACALESDMAALPGRDFTEIGEKGVNLSGGQRQQVSLARAVYQNEDIYLLDDPLSSVNSQTGKLIFDRVIGPKGILKSKTRVFVTHDVQHLDKCDVIYVLKNGTVQEYGGYEELLSRGQTFTDIVRVYKENVKTNPDQDQPDVIRDLFYASLNEADAFESSIRLSGIFDSGSVFNNLSVDYSNGQKKWLSRLDLTDEDAFSTGTKLITEEKEITGWINKGIFQRYIKEAGFITLHTAVWSSLLYMIFQIVASTWLSTWTEQNDVNNGQDRAWTLHGLTVYGCLGFGLVIFAAVQVSAIGYGCYSASRNLLSSFVSVMLHAPMSFYDTTPLGRVMNKFTSNLDVIDATMPIFVQQVFFTLTPLLIMIIVIIYNTPIFTLVFIPLIIAYVFVQRLYVTTLRQWKRIESTRRSPVYIHVDNSVVGASSIKAYNREADFINISDQLVEESLRPTALLATAHRWCADTMEGLASCIVFFACLFAILQRESHGAGAAALSITYALQATGQFQSMVKVISELEAYMIPVEGFISYLSIDSESPWKVKEKEPQESWPENGAIQITNYSTRYRPGLNPVLKNITCYISPGEKIGIVGRTGAGKTSLLLALCRILEGSSGSIFIDEIEIHPLGTHDLRERISIIPQDPVVFSGSVRTNMDPYSKYSDLRIWQALKDAKLRTFIEKAGHGLDYQCGDGGEALSLGQRQLLCLARALLRKSRVLLVDEITAGLDSETEALIHQIINTEFKNSTVITVSHKIQSTVECDRVMVLSKGKLVEFDKPSILLADDTGFFYKMAKAARIV